MLTWVQPSLFLTGILPNPSSRGKQRQLPCFQLVPLQSAFSAVTIIFLQSRSHKFSLWWLPCLLKQASVLGTGPCGPGAFWSLCFLFLLTPSSYLCSGLKCFLPCARTPYPLSLTSSWCGGYLLNLRGPPLPSPFCFISFSITVFTVLHGKSITCVQRVGGTGCFKPLCCQPGAQKTLRCLWNEWTQTTITLKDVSALEASKCWWLKEHWFCEQHTGSRSGQHKGHTLSIAPTSHCWPMPLKFSLPQFIWPRKC